MQSIALVYIGYSAWRFFSPVILRWNYIRVITSNYLCLHHLKLLLTTARFWRSLYLHKSYINSLKVQEKRPCLFKKKLNDHLKKVTMSSLFAVIRQSLGIAAPASRKVAKERLSIMLVHQRNNDNITNLDMNLLQKELR